MFIHNVVERTTVNGPGNRAAVWLAGCTLGCKGCWNPDTHQHGIGVEISPAAIATRLLSIPNLEGVTFSGGEPMQQAHEVLEAMYAIREVTPHMSFGMYTGYTREELDQARYVVWDQGHMVAGAFTGGAWHGIRRMLDFAVMGRYNQLQKTTVKPLCGSSNQNIHLFSDRYTEKDFERQMVEVSIAPGGLTQITGFPVGIHEEVTRGLSG